VSHQIPDDRIPIALTRLKALGLWLADRLPKLLGCLSKLGVALSGHCILLLLYLVLLIGLGLDLADYLVAGAGLRVVMGLCTHYLLSYRHAHLSQSGSARKGGFTYVWVQWTLCARSHTTHSCSPIETIRVRSCRKHCSSG
jgi:hypothetical protein